MHQAAHASLLAGGDDASWQSDMRLVEIRAPGRAAARMQDPDEVDDRACTNEQLVERGVLVEVSFHRLDARLFVEFADLRRIPRRYPHAPPLLRETGDDRATDETAAAGDENELVVHGCLAIRKGGRHLRENGFEPFLE